MEAGEIAQQVGIGVGSTMAVVVGLWMRFLKTQQSRSEAKSANLRAEREALAREIETLRTEHASRMDKLEGRIERHEDKLSHAVSDDAFNAYTQETTKSVSGLAEKVGRVTGSLEAWREQTRKER